MQVRRRIETTSPSPAPARYAKVKASANRNRTPHPALHRRAGMLLVPGVSDGVLFKKFVQWVFNRMSFKPLSLKKLKDQSLDFKSALNTMRLDGITNAQIIEVSTTEGRHVQIIYAKHSNEDSDPKLAVFIAGQHGQVVKHVNTREVLKNWNQGKSICLTSVRGYMGNPGKPNHIGQAKDLVKILDYLESTRKIKPENTELYAHSMGCDTLTNALAIRDSKEQDPERVYKEINLRAPYRSMMDMVMHKIDTKVFLKPFRSDQQRQRVQALLRPLILDSFSNLRYLKAQRIKVAASEADEKVPYAMSKEVYEELARLNPEGNIELTPHPKEDRWNHERTCFHYQTT